MPWLRRTQGRRFWRGKPQGLRYSAIVESLNANQNKIPAVQAKAIQDALRGMEEPTQPVADLLW
jgi:hypothetical protein